MINYDWFEEDWEDTQKHPPLEIREQTEWWRQF